MPNYCQPKLEFSIDPLSDSSPAWTDVTSYLVEASWFSGKAKDLDEPQAGGAQFVLKNTHRDWEPEYSAGRFSGNILPLRRFRWSVVADGVTYSQGLFYAQSFQLSYPNPGSSYSEVVVSCTDGFALLAKDPLLALDPPEASSYGEVVAFDQPFAQYPLNEVQGRKMTAAQGPEGQYKANISQGQSNPILGDADYAVTFPNWGAAGQFGSKAKLDDVDVWHDSNGLTMEAVINKPTSSDTHRIIDGPIDTTLGDNSFTMSIDTTNLRAQIGLSPGGFLTLDTAISAGSHHVAATFDGITLISYIDGAEAARVDASTVGGETIISPDAGESLYIGGAASVTGEITIAQAAVYDYPLSAKQVARHATSALSRGYPEQTAGSRIVALATNPLWSTAGIPAGLITAEPRMQTGQATLDEILETVKAETPIGLFYFDDSGNPAYRPFEYSTTLQATFGEQEVQYDDLGLQYDDEIFNQSTVSRDGGLAQTAIDATSQGQYGPRSHDETGLIIRNDSDAALISQAIVDRFATPMYRIESITLNGAAQNRRTQILTREIGDTIRVKRRGQGGTANPDVITRILGKQKHLDVNKHLTCTWSLARGFPAQDAHFRLGQAGYGELGQTTVLA